MPLSLIINLLVTLAEGVFGKGTGILKNNFVQTATKIAVEAGHVIEDGKKKDWLGVVETVPSLIEDSVVLLKASK